MLHIMLLNEQRGILVHTREAKVQEEEPDGRVRSPSLANANSDL